MYRSLRALLTKLALIATFAHPAPATELPPIKLCFSDFAPYSYEQNGSASGISISIMSEAARRIGRSVQFSTAPWLRCLDEVRSARADGTLDAAAGRNEFIYLDEAPTQVAVAVVVSQNSWIKTLEDLDRVPQERRVILRGSLLPEKTRHFLGDNPKNATTFQSIQKMLELGHADFTLVDLLTFRNLGPDTSKVLRYLRPPIETTELMPIFNTSQLELVRRLQDALRGMKEDGTIDKIYQSEIGLTYTEILEIVSS